MVALADPEKAVDYFRNWLRDGHCPPPTATGSQAVARGAGVTTGGTREEGGLSETSDEEGRVKMLGFVEENWFPLLFWCSSSCISYGSDASSQGGSRSSFI